MKPSSPFVRCGGQTYLVANFTLTPDTPHPSLHDLLTQLLQEHSSDELLILRPLGDDEAKELYEARDDVDIDCWAHIVGRKQ